MVIGLLLKPWCCCEPFSYAITGRGQALGRAGPSKSYRRDALIPKRLGRLQRSTVTEVGRARLDGATLIGTLDGTNGFAAALRLAAHGTRLQVGLWQPISTAYLREVAALVWRLWMTGRPAGMSDGGLSRADYTEAEIHYDRARSCSSCMHGQGLGGGARYGVRE